MGRWRRREFSPKDGTCTSLRTEGPLWDRFSQVSDLPQLDQRQTRSLDRRCGSSDVFAYQRGPSDFLCRFTDCPCSASVHVWRSTWINRLRVGSPRRNYRRAARIGRSGDALTTARVEIIQPLRLLPDLHRSLPSRWFARVVRPVLMVLEGLPGIKALVKCVPLRSALKNGGVRTPKCHQP